MKSRSQYVWSATSGVSREEFIRNIPSYEARKAKFDKLKGRGPGPEVTHYHSKIMDTEVQSMTIFHNGWEVKVNHYENDPDKVQMFADKEGEETRYFSDLVTKADEFMETLK